MWPIIRSIISWVNIAKTVIFELLLCKYLPRHVSPVSKAHISELFKTLPVALHQLFWLIIGLKLFENYFG